MGYVGFIQCPDCQSPIDSDANVCPYCYSNSPATAPWQGDGNGSHVWGWVLVGGALAIFGAAVASDHWFGTSWSTQLIEFFRRKD